MMRINLLVIFMLCINPLAQAQEIYKWVDEQGKVHFGDRKPDSQQNVEELNIKLVNSVETVSYQVSSIDIGKKVVIYTTSWCGYCKKAKKYFSDKRIRYTEKNIEKSKIAKMEFKKLGGKGVPIILVGKKKMSGFSQAGFELIYAP
ncbi:glutaredoxin domain-containing protein [Litorilituus lipolyticus]|uniref:DUF4124 domain-containing protein n=1 Tax=Litorilituus lipolyticus TaxID=2491017 RepID=A0A502KU08_9GAMM|nr:glutaredoxin domain-containing protein [Litorilituus lipolyticus]TPH14614.1 DUF4124 domain-containing protein [Litorilituus lipolyticus]